MRNEKLGNRVARVVASRIIEAVTDGRDPGLPTEREIADEFDVSMTVAREVVALLVSMMMVRVHHGRRMQLMPPSAWNYLHPVMLELQDDEGRRQLIAELFDLRLLVEPEAAARAADKATSAGIARMEELLRRFRSSEHNIAERYECDVTFHQEIMASSSNRPLAHVLDSANELLKFSRVANESSPAWSAELIDSQHSAILDAIRARDAEAARAAMREHLLWGLEHIEGNAEPAPATQ
jgi:DNA-binding FadR family transcriptional regulator